MREQLKRLLFSTGLIVLVAFLVRLVSLYHYFHVYEMPAIRDMVFGGETGAVAAAIAEGRGFSSPLPLLQTGPTAWFTPIYPYILAAIFKLFGVFSYESSLYIRMIDVALSAFTIWPIRAIGTKAFGRGIGTVAAWFWVFLPGGIYFPVYWVWDTELTALWLALLIAATLEIRGSDRMRSWIGYGALWAAGAMINASVLSVLPFLALWALWPLRSQFAHAAKLGAISALVFFAGIAPWTIRNYEVFHKFIPLRSNFGLELWLGNNPEVWDSCSCTLHPDDNAEEAAKYARMTEIPYMEEKQQIAVAFIRTNPLKTAYFIFRRFEIIWLGLWDAPFDVWVSGSFYLKLTIAWNCLFALLSLLGALFACRARSDAALPLASVMLAFPAIFYLTHPSARYRYPMDSIMLILTAYAMATLLSKLASRFSNTSNAVEPATHAAN